MHTKKRLFFEIGFFFFYFFVLPVFSDFQYKLEFKQEDLGASIFYRLLTAPLAALPYFIFYRLQLVLLFEKRYIRFCLSIIVFICLLETFAHLTDWYTYQNPLFSDAIRKSGRTNFWEPLFPRQMFSLTFTRLLTLTGLGYFIQKLEDEIKLRHLKEQHLQLELQFLKAQLQPHFFFNTLNNIYSLALDASSRTAPTIAKLAGLMRYIIYDGPKKTVPLVKEIEFIRNYLDLERIRHADHTRVQFLQEGVAEGIVVEPLIFIPLIENGFKHGINNSLGKSWLDVRMQIHGDTIQLQVRNSVDRGKAPQKRGGMGLDNICKRLQLLYPNQHSFFLQEEENAFSATLTLKRK